MAGLTENGLVRKRLPEILTDIVEEQRQEISNNIANTEDTLIGQLNTIIGKSLDELWELLEAVNDNFNRRRAEGNALDDLGDLIGVTRLMASRSTGRVYIRAEEGTTLLAQAELHDPLTENTVRLRSTRVVTAADCEECLLKVGRVLPLTQYSLTVDGTTFNHTSSVDPDEEEILVAFATAINNADIGVYASASLVMDGDWALFVGNADSTFQRQISVQRDAYLVFGWVAVWVVAESLEPGPVSVPPETITEFITPVSGVILVVNTQAFTLGRLEETDEDYRNRFSLSTEDGKATINAIIAALLGVSGVSQVRAYENTTMTIDAEGRPPKSLEVVVVGGTDADIGQKLFDTKAAGIQTYGNTQVVVEDLNGVEHSVYITIPEAVYIAVRVTYTLYDEEVFPSNGEALIKDAIYAYIEGLNVDTDVIPTRLYGPTYSAVDGVDSVYVEIQVIEAPGTPPEALEWQDTKVAVAYNEKAYTTADDIYFVTP